MPLVQTVAEKDRTYWLTVPHVFKPAPWGPEYCRLCSQKESGEKVEHLDREKLSERDPRRWHHDRTIVASPDEIWYKVEGWNDSDDASCTYGCEPSLEAAIEVAHGYATEGDDRGRRYEHYDVLEMHFERVVSTDVHPVDTKVNSA